MTLLAGFGVVGLFFGKDMTGMTLGRDMFIGQLSTFVVFCSGMLVAVTVRTAYILFGMFRNFPVSRTCPGEILA